MKENYIMVELKDYIDDVEVGMVIGLYNREKYSFISGIVTRNGYR